MKSENDLLSQQVQIDRVKHKEDEHQLEEMATENNQLASTLALTKSVKLTELSS